MLFDRSVALGAMLANQTRFVVPDSPGDDVDIRLRHDGSEYQVQAQHPRGFRVLTMLVTDALRSTTPSRRKASTRHWWMPPTRHCTSSRPSLQRGLIPAAAASRLASQSR